MTTFSRVSLLVLFLCSSMAGAACQAAELPPIAKAEIEAMLNRLGESGCQFNRNGSWYTAVEAKKHLSSKLNYVIEKKLANSAEQFIETAATKSSMSGTPYLVKCTSAPAVPSAIWLSNTLKELRLKSGT